MLEKERVSPCGAGERRCYFLNDQKVTKESLGAASGERLRGAGAHSHCPQTPFTGDALLGNWYFHPAGIVVAKSALFRTPKCGHPSCRSLAPPLPTKPASLGFGGDPNNEWLALLASGTQAPARCEV